MYSVFDARKHKHRHKPQTTNHKHNITNVLSQGPQRRPKINVWRNAKVQPATAALAESMGIRKPVLQPVLLLWFLAVDQVEYG